MLKFQWLSQIQARVTKVQTNCIFSINALMYMELILNYIADWGHSVLHTLWESGKMGHAVGVDCG